eukprot:TRINITY_DN899_c0_g1_i3.p1 TRINITY_DN899_c0_g1~~TRINITY_DN899_c0_g1_i3.p1  ORF type:complete len:281 (-),score=59.56 TRINITY_DN899_c0_g1_i3:27-869(-)
MDSINLMKNFKVAFLTNANYDINKHSKKWGWDIYLVSSSNDPIKYRFDFKKYQLILLDGGNVLSGEQHEYFGDELCSFVESGGNVLMMGWSPYTDGIYGFGGSFLKYYPNILKDDEGVNWREQIKHPFEIEDIEKSEFFHQLEYFDWPVRKNPDYVTMNEGSKVILGTLDCPLLIERKIDRGRIVTLNSRSDSIPFNFVHNTMLYMMKCFLEWNPEVHSKFPTFFKIQTYFFMLCMLRKKKEKKFFLPKFVAFEIIKSSFVMVNFDLSGPEMGALKSKFN